MEILSWMDRYRPGGLVDCPSIYFHRSYSGRAKLIEIRNGIDERRDEMSGWKERSVLSHFSTCLLE
jgi:hypothetical protein